MRCSVIVASVAALQPGIPFHASSSPEALCRHALANFAQEITWTSLVTTVHGRITQCKGDCRIQLLFSLLLHVRVLTAVDQGSERNLSKLRFTLERAYKRSG
eukprot:5599878-Amphidinium_carterae.2